MGAPGPWPNGSLQWPGLQRRLTARIGTAMYWAPEVAGHSMFDHGWCHLVSGYSNPIKKKHQKPSKAIEYIESGHVFFHFFGGQELTFRHFAGLRSHPCGPGLRSIRRPLELGRCAVTWQEKDMGLAIGESL